MNRRNAVVTIAAVAHVVAVDLVDNILTTVGVRETCRIDGTALIKVALDSIANGGVWTLGSSRGSSPEAMLYKVE